MQYLLLFFEGIITFISPCMITMIPIYVSWFAGSEDSGIKKTLINSLGFVLGFTVVFVAMGAAAGTVGSFISAHQQLLNIVCGIIVALFGLSYMGLFQIKAFKGVRKRINPHNMNFWKAVLFGVIFSVGWTPCVGAFLGSALMIASAQGHVLQGSLMLLVYSLGLGIPFVVCSILIDQLKVAFAFLKDHSRAIELVCGGFLVVIGIAMASGFFGFILGLFS